jgi:hypothetical protein
MMKVTLAHEQGNEPLDQIQHMVKNAHLTTQEKNDAAGIRHRLPGQPAGECLLQPLEIGIMKKTTQQSRGLRDMTKVCQFDNTYQCIYNEIGNANETIMKKHVIEAT